MYSKHMKSKEKHKVEYDWGQVSVPPVHSEEKQNWDLRGIRYRREM